MEQERFDIVFKNLIHHEGGFQNNRGDKGNWTGGNIGLGENKGTKFGISAKAYPDLDIKNLTLEDAKEIYRRDYWKKIQGEKLGPGLDNLVMDIAVNAGPQKGARYLQQALGLKADGRIGDETLDAVRWLTDDGRSAVINDTSARRLSHWQNSSGWEDNKRGWTARGKDVRERVHGSAKQCVCYA